MPVNYRVYRAASSLSWLKAKSLSWVEVARLGAMSKSKLGSLGLKSILNFQDELGSVLNKVRFAS